MLPDIRRMNHMPLVVCVLFFIVLFSCEGFWYSAKAAREEMQLRRYREIEHPRHNRSDSYLDLDWA